MHVHPSRRRFSGLTALFGAVALASLGGCVLKSPPDTATIQAEALPSAAVPEAWTAQGAAAGLVADDWLTSFADPQLAAIVAEALAHNADLRVAASRVEQARLHARLAGARLWPSVDLLARAVPPATCENSGLYRCSSRGSTMAMSWTPALRRRAATEMPPLPPPMTRTRWCAFSMARR